MDTHSVNNQRIDWFYSSLDLRWRRCRRVCSKQRRL